MKKKLLMLGVSLLSLSISYAKYPVLKRETNGGGIFGYASTKESWGSWDDGQGGLKHGWAVECNGSGLESCPKLGEMIRPTLPPDFDGAQYETCMNLQNYVYDQVAAGVTRGGKAVKVKVEGESTTRLYELTWDFSNGNETYTITRDDISFVAN
ncbi:MAG: hypothetical protein V4620_11205 [Bacteroidota bacterium]